MNTVYYTTNNTAHYSPYTGDFVINVGPPSDEAPSLTDWLKGSLRGTYYEVRPAETVPIYLWGNLQTLSNQIEKVIFNEPATIILWKNGHKTVVKAQDGEPFDKEKGFLMAIEKKMNDNKGNYNNIIKKWCE